MKHKRETYIDLLAKLIYETVFSTQRILPQAICQATTDAIKELSGKGKLGPVVTGDLISIIQKNQMLVRINSGGLSEEDLKDFVSLAFIVNFVTYICECDYTIDMIGKHLKTLLSTEPLYSKLRLESHKMSNEVENLLIQMKKRIENSVDPRSLVEVALQLTIAITCIVGKLRNSEDFKELSLDEVKKPCEEKPIANEEPTHVILLTFKRKGLYYFKKFTKVKGMELTQNKQEAQSFENTTQTALLKLLLEELEGSNFYLQAYSENK